MARDISRAVDEYKKKYKGEDAFLVTDVLRIKEISEAGSVYDTLYNAIVNALRAGYIMGYRRAQRDAKRKAKEG